MVICALLPTAFVTGMIGQYVRPLPIGASLGMLFSLFVALTVAPYLCYLLLRPGSGSSPSRGHKKRSRFMSFYLGVGVDYGEPETHQGSLCSLVGRPAFNPCPDPGPRGGHKALA